MATYSSILAWRIPWTEDDDGGTTWRFSSCGGILELGQEIQASSCVGPGKSSLPFELQGRARDCA